MNFRVFPHEFGWFLQGSHASWKVLDFFFKIPGPGKFCKITLVWKVLKMKFKILENLLHQMSYFKAKMHQIRFWLGLCPRPHAGGAHCAVPDLLAGFKDSTSKGREREG